jgi:hypothetical protein
MLNTRIILLIFTLGFFLSCNKSEDSKTLKSQAVLKWFGDYAVDGCGFFITINSHSYKPENESIIDNSFKSDSCNVTVEYQLLDKKISSSCGFISPIKTDGIKIISITKNK